MITNNSKKTIASAVALSIVLLCSLPAQARGGHGFSGGKAMGGLQGASRGGNLGGFKGGSLGGSQGGLGGKFGGAQGGAQGIGQRGFGGGQGLGERGAFQNGIGNQSGLIGRGGEQRQFPNQGNQPFSGQGNRAINNHPADNGNLDNNTRTVSGNGDTTNNYSYTNNGSAYGAYGASGAYGAHPGAPYAAAGYAYGHSAAYPSSAYPYPYPYAASAATLPIGMGLGAMLAKSGQQQEQPVVVQQTTQPAANGAQTAEQARLNGQQFAQGIAETIRANALRYGSGISPMYAPNGIAAPNGFSNPNGFAAPNGFIQPGMAAPSMQPNMYGNVQH